MATRYLNSTTDSPEEVDKALGVEKEEKPEEKAAEVTESKPEEKPDKGETEGSSEESGEPEAAEEQDASEEKPEHRRRSKNGFQRRIDKLTREKFQLEARLAEYERQLNAKPAQEQHKTQPAQPEGKPRLDQFQSYDEYVEALADWKFQERLARAQAEAAQRLQQEAAQKQQEEFKSRFEAYRDRVEEAAERYEDWDDVTSKNILVPESASIAIIESENGPDITYYLGKHPEIVDELHGLTPAQQISRIAVIGYELAHPKPQRVQTKAPVPVQPVGGSSAQGNALPPEPTYQDYRRKWLQESA